MPMGSDAPTPKRWAEKQKQRKAHVRRCLGPIDRQKLEALKASGQITDNDYDALNSLMLEMEKKGGDRA